MGIIKTNKKVESKNLNQHIPLKVKGLKCCKCGAVVDITYNNYCLRHNKENKKERALK